VGTDSGTSRCRCSEPTFLFVSVVVSRRPGCRLRRAVGAMTAGGPLNKDALTIVMMMYQQGFKFWRMGYAAAVAFILFRKSSAQRSHARLQMRLGETLNRGGKSFLLHAVLIAGGLITLSRCSGCCRRRSCRTADRPRSAAHPSACRDSARAIYRPPLFLRLEPPRPDAPEDGTIVAATVTVCSVPLRIDGRLRIRQAAFPRARTKLRLPTMTAIIVPPQVRHAAAVLMMKTMHIWSTPTGRDHPVEMVTVFGARLP